MASLISDADVPKGPDQKPLVGGWFCVDHTKGRLWLIFDRRPQNSTEKQFDWLNLPLGSQLIHLELEKDECMRGSGDDLECWFYTLSDPPGWNHKNVVGRRLA